WQVQISEMGKLFDHESLVDYPFLVPPDEKIWGQVNLGFCETTGAPVGIYPHEVHTLIAGGTNSGKTTLLTHIIRQHIDAGIPVLIFDYENDFPERLDDVNVNKLDLDDLRWNPLEVPPGVNPVLYLQQFCATFSDNQGLLTGSKGYLLSQIHHLFELYGVFEGSNSFPSMFDLSDFLAAKMRRTKSNTREYTYLEVSHNRIDNLVKALPNVLDCSIGMPLHILTRSNLVLLLSGLDFELQTLLVTLMLTWLCRYFIANGMRNNPDYRIAVFLDEAQRLYDRQQEHRVYQGIPVISHLTATVRKYNLSLFVAVQQPSMLASSMTANAHTKIQLRLGDGKDIMDLGTSMFLTPEQVYYSRLIETGQAIVKFPGGRWPEPFIIRIPYEEQEQ
ncbi:ATP-binding protein, partial [Candidatus Poribacteria bacterium]